MDLGSCQYDNIGEVVSHHIENIKKCLNLEDVKVYLSDNLKFTSITINEIPNEDIISQCRNRLIESDLAVFDIEFSVDEVTKMYIDGILNTIENEDEDAIKQLEEAFKCKTIDDVIIQCKNDGWDLWGCLGTFAIHADIVCRHMESEDIELAATMLYLIWKFKIEDPESVFAGFAT